MNPQEIYVFVVDDEPAVQMAVQRTLASVGIRVEVFSNADACLAALSQRSCDVIITDLRLADKDGLSLLQEAKCRFPWLQIIVVTGYGGIAAAVKAMKMGAVDFLEKPLDRLDLLSAVEAATKASTEPVPYPRTPLSHVEAQVLRLFLTGLTAKDTAKILHRSSRTVEAHRRRLMHKFAVRNAVQLAQRASLLWKDDLCPSVT